MQRPLTQPIRSATVRQHGFYARPRLRHWSIIRFAAFNCFDDMCWCATPRTPPLWQRSFPLVECFDIATFVGFGEKRCRKNLPLCDLTNQIVTFYKLTTIHPCPTDVFLEFVRSCGSEAGDDGASNPLEFTDHTGTVYRIKFVEDRATGYASADCTITIEPKRLGFEQINNFAKFCSDNDLGLRRGGVEIHGPGGLASDIFSSEAHRIASHLSDQMRGQT